MFVVIRFIKSNIDFRHFLIFFDFEKIVFVCFFFEKLDLVEMKVDFEESISNLFENDLFKIKLR